MGYVIAAIIVIFCILLITYFIRKKYYKEIERLESWKIDITNRPILDEMSKVKQLNMTGQTELLFDGWRKEWDEIVACELPDIEEYFIDTEDYLDKYRFKKAGKVLIEIEKILNDVEMKIKKLLAELNELVGSEQKNKEEMEELKEKYRESKKILFAHRHSFVTAADSLEDQLDAMIEQFLEFEDKTENGNYLDARKVVFTIKETLDIITEKMEKLPQLFIDCQTGIPLQLNELKAGYHEMLDQGYRLEHIQFENELACLESELKDFLLLLQQTEVAEVESGLETVKASLDLLYESLEKEVHAKHYIQKQKDETASFLAEITQNSSLLKKETELVQQTYHVAETDLEAQRQLEKQLSGLMKRHEQLELNLNIREQAESVLAQDLIEIRDMLQVLKEQQDSYSETLQSLRKEELVARDKIFELKKKITGIIRTITKSKIPGLPQEYHFLLDDAEESIQIVSDKLKEKPLDIPTVQHYLEAAVMTVEKLVSETTELLDNVMLAEKVIQYGNRYKSSYPTVAAGLYEAELAFRSFDYKAALEQAATTIEKVEPGAFKKIEALLYEEVM